MNFRQKIYWAIFGPAIVLILILTGFYYSYSKKQIQETYVSKYVDMGTVVADSLFQLERTTDILTQNSIRFLQYEYKNRGIPSNERLAELAKDLHVSRLYVVERDGTFIRDSKGNPAANTTKLFDFCEGYRKLLTGETAIEQTPIITTQPFEGPYKFTMAPTEDRSRILEIGMQLSFIGDVLNKILSSDVNIESIGLFSPSGQQLGYISRNGTIWNSPDVFERDLFTPISIDSEKGELVFLKTLPSQTSQCCECKTKGLTAAGTDKYFYYLRIQVAAKPMFALMKRLRWVSLLALVVFLLVAGVLANLLSKRIVGRISKFQSGVRMVMDSGNLQYKLNLPGNDEVASLAQNFDLMTERLRLNQEDLLRAEKDRVLVQVASQVAHDIQSPVSAIHIMASTIPGIDEERLTILRQATDRILSISNSLLEQRQGGQENARPTNLAALLEEIYSEKKLNFSRFPGVQFDLELETSALDCVVSVRPHEFKRCISNALNNSLEAKKEGGCHIRLTMKSVSDSVVGVQVIDDGIGIPAALRDRIFVRGVTSKKGGHGLGLSYLKEEIERCRGTVLIESEEGRGTRLLMELPKIRHVNAYLACLELQNVAEVIICDDESFYFEAWQRRLANRPQRIQYWKSLEKARQELSRSPLQDKQLLLMDLRFAGESQAGLDLVRDFGVGKRTVLVTSAYADEGALLLARELGIKILPKNLISFVDIK